MKTVSRTSSLPSSIVIATWIGRNPVRSRYSNYFQNGMPAWVARRAAGFLRTVLLSAMWAGLLPWGTQAAGAELNFGFFYDRFDLTLSEGQRTEAAGPFYFREQRGDERTWALPPLFSAMRDPSLEVAEYDFFYPLFTYDRYGQQFRAQFFQLLSYSGGATQTETNRNRFTLFPLYFQQRSSDPAENYTAVFPFYGHLLNRFMRDEIHFVMFPGYVQTRKKDVVTDNFLYPVFHLRQGDGLRGWQFWPLVGSEHKEITYRTNHWGDSELVGGHDRFMAGWPLFHNQRNGIGTTNAQWQQTLLPLYSLLRSPFRDSTTVIWPFFSRIDDREKQYVEWHAPYPFVVFADGAGKTTRRVWPFFSESHSPILRSDTYLWPVYKYNRAQAAPLDRERTRILFFLYSDTIERNTEAKTYRRRLDAWPLFTHKRDHKGSTRLQVLSLLEPLVPGSHKIERDWSPVYSLWRAEKNAVTGASSQSLLWNLYRHDSTPGSSEWSACFGLVQHRKNAQGTQWRLFHVPLGQRRQSEGVMP